MSHGTLEKNLKESDQHQRKTWKKVINIDIGKNWQKASIYASASASTSGQRKLQREWFAKTSQLMVIIRCGGISRSENSANRTGLLVLFFVFPTCVWLWVLGMHSFAIFFASFFPPPPFMGAILWFTPLSISCTRAHPTKTFERGSFSPSSHDLPILWSNFVLDIIIMHN